MPVIGIISTEHRLIPAAVALQEAYTHGHCDGVDLLSLIQMFDNREPTIPSASTIATGAYRRSVLESQVSHYVDPDDRVALFRGTMVHAGYEHVVVPNDYPVIRELRLSANTAAGNRFSGQIDLYFPSECRLIDFKTTSQVPKSVKLHHIKQLAVYAHLLRKNGYSVKDAGIVYVGDYVQYAPAYENAKKTLVPVIQHPLLAQPKKVEELIDHASDVLLPGYRDHILPSVRECTRQWCRFCPVKWACDALPPEGGLYQPLALDQSQYQAG